MLTVTSCKDGQHKLNKCIAHIHHNDCKCPDKFSGVAGVGGAGHRHMVGKGPQVPVRFRRLPQAQSSHRYGDGKNLDVDNPLNSVELDDSTPASWGHRVKGARSAEPEQWWDRAGE